MVGWDERTPPNETVDEYGNPSQSNPGFGVADPRAPKRRVYDDPDVVALRDHLRLHNGIHGLEIVAPDEVARAARIFHRDGFVVVRDLLNAEQLERFRGGCARVIDDILSIPGLDGRRYMTETSRLPHRYSFGTSSASRHLMHDPVWTSMIDLPTTTPILTEIFGTADYLVRGGGGDFCLPGAIEYQHLHWDFKDPLTMPPERLQQAAALGIELRKRPDSDELDLATQRLVVERTPPLVTINFLMSELTWENGPIRQIPGTHASQTIATDSGRRTGMDAALDTGWRTGGRRRVPRHPCVARRHAESRAATCGRCRTSNTSRRGSTRSCSRSRCRTSCGRISRRTRSGCAATSSANPACGRAAPA